MEGRLEEKERPGTFLANSRESELLKILTPKITYQESGNMTAMQAQPPAHYSKGSPADHVGN